jgi:hypothetical protein
MRMWCSSRSSSAVTAAAIIYSLVESCRRVGVDPQIYHRDVLIRVATHPASRVHELAPANWKSLFAHHAGN